MTLVKRKQNHINPYDELDSMVKTIFNTDWNFPSQNIQECAPPVDIKETDKVFIIKSDITGLTKKDIKINIKDRLLTISGERQEDVNNSDDYYHYRERSTGKFHRSFNLPESIDEDKIKANFKNGVLIIELEKHEEILPKEKEIKIN